MAAKLPKHPVRRLPEAREDLKGMSKDRRQKVLAAVYDVAHYYLTGEPPGRETCDRLMAQGDSTFIETTALGYARREQTKKNRDAISLRHADIGHVVFAVMTQPDEPKGHKKHNVPDIPDVVAERQAIAEQLDAVLAAQPVHEVMRADQPQ